MPIRSFTHKSETCTNDTITNSFTLQYGAYSTDFTITVSKEQADDPQLQIGFPNIPAFKRAIIISVDDNEFKSPRINIEEDNNAEIETLAYCRFPSCKVHFFIHAGEDGGVSISVFDTTSDQPELIDSNLFFWDEIFALDALPTEQAL